jgi:hypothetical protein
VFDTPDGPKRLLDMSGTYGQLVVSQFMDNVPTSTERTARHSAGWTVSSSSTASSPSPRTLARRTARICRLDGRDIPRTDRSGTKNKPRPTNRPGLRWSSGKRGVLRACRTADGP